MSAGEAARVLGDLLEAHSPSGREDEAARVLADHANRLGLQARRDEVGNVRVRRPGAETDAPAVLLLGHLDTVSGELPVERDGAGLAGRGAVDAKGPLAAHLLALARLDADLDVQLVAAVGEEATGRGARHLRETLDAPDGLAIAEPTGASTVGLGYKGRLLADVEARAVPSHPGAPPPTAPERLVEAIEGITEATGNPERDVGADETTVRVVDLDARGGARRETATARLDVRFPGAVPSLDPEHGGLPEGVELEVREAVAGVRADPRNPLATALRGSLRARGREPRWALKTGTSDWNVVAEAWECPGLAYGPGDSTLAHTPDERIEPAAVAEAADALAGALQRLADGRRSRPQPSISGHRSE